MSTSSVRKSDRQGNALIAQQLQQGPITTGATGRGVKAIEDMLKLAGFDVGKIDGTFDQKTADALAKFEEAAGVANPDSVFDQSSFDELKGVQARVRKHAGKPFYGQGQAGKRVAEAQAELKRLGYDPGRGDGVFDAQTAKAVAAFKKDQGIKEDSQFLGKRSLGDLKSETDAFKHAPYRGRVTKDLKAHKRLDQATGAAAAQGNGIGPQSPKRLIKNVQVHLRAAGFDPKRTDGVMDERTQAALEAFQRKAKLDPTGRVDAKTWPQLSKAMFSAKNGTSPAQSKGEKSGAVLRSEKLLKKLGYKHVKADGIFDQATQKASRAFEKKYRGLGKDGKIGAPQLERMQQVLRAKQHPGKGPTVAKGYTGKPVRELEARLKKMGFNPGKIDGKFDKKTASAVRRMQRAFNLKADGVVGKKTWRMLGIQAHGSVTPPGKTVTAYVGGVPRKIKVSSVGNGQYLRTDAAKHFLDMMKAAHAAGFNLYANSGFRTMAEQEHLYWLSQHGGNPAAPPGYSNHQGGVAMDIGNVGSFGSSAYNWLARNAGRFGFNNVEGRGVNEPWHWVYQG